jgi:hypothetical protein
MRWYSSHFAQLFHSAEPRASRPLVQLIGIAPGGRNAPRATLSAGNRSTGGRKGWCTVHLASGTLLRI